MTQIGAAAIRFARRVEDDLARRRPDNAHQLALCSGRAADDACPLRYALWRWWHIHPFWKAAPAFPAPSDGAPSLSRESKAMSNLRLTYLPAREEVDVDVVVLECLELFLDFLIQSTPAAATAGS